MSADILQRLERIESELAIQQLPARYAIAIDSRNIDAWLNLFVADVNCGRHGKGREALRRWIEPAVKTFYRSHHQICGQVIDFVDDDHATGTVYCRAEHEDGDRWIVMAICYFDRYERRDGQWYFVSRDEQHWYACDALERPQGVGFQGWDAWSENEPRLPQGFPSWKRFWESSDPELIQDLSFKP